MVPHQALQAQPGDHNLESESLIRRLCDALTDDVPLFELFIEQLELFLVKTSNFGVSIVFHTLRDEPLFFIRGGGGGLPLLGLADNFFQRIIRFKQFFSLDFVMKTIFL